MSTRCVALVAAIVAFVTLPASLAHGGPIIHEAVLTPSPLSIPGAIVPVDPGRFTADQDFRLSLLVQNVNPVEIGITGVTVQILDDDAFLTFADDILVPTQFRPIEPTIQLQTGEFRRLSSNDYGAFTATQDALNDAIDTIPLIGIVTEFTPLETFAMGTVLYFEKPNGPTQTVPFSTIPEPSTPAILGIGVSMLFVIARWAAVRRGKIASVKVV
jgi:hypothetical protein